MKQFELFFKIIKKNALQFVIYMFILVAFSGLMTLSDSDKKEAFQIANIKIGVINHDKDGVISRGIVDYVKENAEYVEIEEEEESIQDALFFRSAEYIIVIPKDFTQDMIEGREVKLEKIQIPGSYSAVYMDTKINQYLNTLKLYLVSVGENMVLEEIIERIHIDLKEEVSVETTRESGINNESSMIKQFFNFSVYSVLTIAILGIGAVLSINKEKNIRNRNLVSPVKSQFIDFAMLIGSFILMTVVWLVCIMIAIIIYKDSVLNSIGYMHALNLFAVCIVSLSIGFLIGSIFTNSSVRMAAANTVSLSLCFVSGVFVPQEILSQTINIIASFTPIYWYVKGNNEISSLLEVKLDSIKPIITYMGIQLLFAAAIMSAGLLISKQKSFSRE